jgi:hypothetical protein
MGGRRDRIEISEGPRRLKESGDFPMIEEGPPVPRESLE